MCCGRFLTIDGGAIRRNCIRRTPVWIALLSGLPGCAHDVRFNAFVKTQVEPVQSASAVPGSVEEAKALFDQAKLPHINTRNRYEIERRANQALRAQLGSQDYVLLGEVYGRGDARTNLETLKVALSEKAAAKGGNAVLLFQQGVEERQYAYSTPGYARTNVYGSAQRIGNYAYGRATANTTYTPGQTFAGTMYFPHANGLVFRHVAGVEQRRIRGDGLKDAELERVLNGLDALWQDEKLSLAQVLERWDELLDDAGSN
jgi:hypothetical protein